MKKIVKDRIHAGRHNVRIDVHDLKAGLYICEFKAGIYQETKKLLIIK
jgi:hypothetical protein